MEAPRPEAGLEGSRAKVSARRFGRPSRWSGREADSVNLRLTRSRSMETGNPSNGQRPEAGCAGAARTGPGSDRADVPGPSGAVWWSGRKPCGVRPVYSTSSVFERPVTVLPGQCAPWTECGLAGARPLGGRRSIGRASRDLGELTPGEELCQDVHHARDARVTDDEAIGAPEIPAAKGFTRCRPLLHQRLDPGEGHDGGAPARTVAEPDLDVDVADGVQGLTGIREE